MIFIGFVPALIICLMIFCKDRHNLIFHEKRVVNPNKEIWIWKFRTMRYDSYDHEKYFTKEQNEQSELNFGINFSQQLCNDVAELVKTYICLLLEYSSGKNTQHTTALIPQHINGNKIIIAKCFLHNYNMSLKAISPPPLLYYIFFFNWFSKRQIKFFYFSGTFLYIKSIFVKVVTTFIFNKNFL